MKHQYQKKHHCHSEIQRTIFNTCGPFTVLVSLLFLLFLFAAACDNSTLHQQKTYLSEGDTLSLTVMATTDIHGRVRAWDYYRNQKEPRYALSKTTIMP